MNLFIRSPKQRLVVSSKVEEKFLELKVNFTRLSCCHVLRNCCKADPCYLIIGNRESGAVVW